VSAGLAVRRHNRLAPAAVPSLAPLAHLLDLALLRVDDVVGQLPELGVFAPLQLDLGHADRASVVGTIMSMKARSNAFADQRP
jgi:hypothetical protein